MYTIGALDIETFTLLDSIEVYCICYTSNNKTHTFYYNDDDVFLKFLKSLIDTQYCFWVHNLTFDALILLKHIDKNCTNVTWFSKNYTIYWIKFKFKDISVELRCFYKFLPLPLNTLATKILNKEKLTFPYKILNKDFLNIKIWKPNVSDFNTSGEYETFIKKNSTSSIDIKTYLINYCKNDVMLLDELLNKFINSLKNKNIKLLKHSYSISSYSVNYCINKYNNFQKKLPKNIEYIIRESYFGGRCEVFGNALENEYTYHFDFRGMYSLCMKERLPTYNFRYEEVNDINKPGFYKITFTSNLDIPILPIKTDLLYFPNGQYTGIYWYEEINLFLDEGGIINKIHFVISCDVDNCLENFSKEFDYLRSQGPCQNLIGKLVINSFYGRLGARDWDFKDVISNEPLAGAISYIKIQNLYINKTKTKTNKYSNVAIASAITAKARIKLYKVFKDVIGWRGRLLYCDTDSIVASFKNENILGIKNNSGLCFDPTKPDTLIKKSWFAGPKTYSIIFNNNLNVTKIKGVPKNSICFEQFVSLFLANRPIKITSQPTLYKKNYIYRVETLEKIINLNKYKKRIFINDYTSTKPLSKVPTIDTQFDWQFNK